MTDLCFRLRWFEKLSVKNGHVHDVDTSLRVVGVLFELDEALFDTKSDYDFCLRGDNKVGNRDDTFWRIIALTNIL